MRGKRLSIGLRAALAIIAATLFATSTWAQIHEQVLHNFQYNGTDGVLPFAGLIFDAAGNLYSTTSEGGTYGVGTVFELTPAAGGGWTETVLHSFGNGTDGRGPNALIFDAAGNLYGTTSWGGTYTYGTVFELTPAAGGGWTEQVLYSFCSQTNCTDGAHPVAGLIFDAAGNLYGTTGHGGVYASCNSGTGCGTVFELTPTAGGGWTEKVLHNFGNGTDGNSPSAGLIFDAASNLYGTTYVGGIYCSGSGGCGTVFELTPAAGGTWTETVLYSFCPAGYPCTDGIGPEAGLIFDAAGNLYGTTVQGGRYDYGTVFELSPTAGGGWTETVLHNFGNGLDGVDPSAGLIFDAAGNLYGTTSWGGYYGHYEYGTVFELTPAASGGWTETVLHSFGNGTDGRAPLAGLIFDAAGNLYGTTSAGGTDTSCPNGGYGCGTVFELQTAVTYTLTVSVFGDGTVASTDGFISCPGPAATPIPGIRR